jgi:SRSO17 transposase
MTAQVVGDSSSRSVLPRSTRATSISGFPASSHLSGTDAFTEWILDTLPRADQRRWGAAYVRGLLDTPGRKSVRGMAGHISGGNVEQSLQQFINQSPWDWAPVRARLAETVRPLVRPYAWTVDEVAFPKNGERSVGVARQFAAPLGRFANCQIGIALSAVGDQLSCPVGWRLTLPPRWDQDIERRSITGVPAHERHRPRWHDVLTLLAEMPGPCGLAETPVLLDARYGSNPEPLLRGLEQLGLSYLVLVSPSARMGAGARAGEPRELSAPIGQLALASARHNQVFLRWQEGPDAPWRRSRFAVGPLPSTVGPAAAAGPRGRDVLAEWQPGTQLPRTCWISNIHNRRLPDLVELATTRWRSRAALTNLEQNFGLLHFEGRSYRGWHHHVTLVSASYVYDRLRADAEANTGDDAGDDTVVSPPAIPAARRA